MIRRHVLGLRVLLAGLVPEGDGEEDVYTELEEDKSPVVLSDGCEEVGESRSKHACTCLSLCLSVICLNIQHINTLSRTE